MGLQSTARTGRAGGPGTVSGGEAVSCALVTGPGLRIQAQTGRGRGAGRERDAAATADDCGDRDSAARCGGLSAIQTSIERQTALLP